MDGLEIQTELIRKQGMFNIKKELLKNEGRNNGKFFRSQKTIKNV